MNSVPTLTDGATTTLTLEGDRRPRVGDVLHLTKSPQQWSDGKVTIRCTLTAAERPVGPRLMGYWQHLIIGLGPHVVDAVTGAVVIVRPLPQAPEDEARNFRMAVRRLRTLARGELMRVRVRDREVDLIDPGNNVAFRGTVNGAFAWLCGFPNWSDS